jgi:hypothetical protein
MIMVSNRDVFGYLKGNVGEESVLNIIVMSAGKAFISVAIIVAGIVAAMTLAGQYGETAYAFILVYLFFSLLWCMILLGGYENTRRIDTWQASIDHRKWKNFPHILNFKGMLYFDWDGSNVYPMEQVTHYILSGVLSAVTVILALIIGSFLIYAGAFIYAFYLAFYIPSESLITIATIGGSILLMSLLFIKLKWKKIFLENINWNLFAWCICAAVIITMISFVTGAAIRRIAGYIGIEYTIGLVSIYVIITAIYVINDLRQWMDNKAREELKKIA